jgi:carbamoyl-phosphate synthase large subunit
VREECAADFAGFKKFYPSRDFNDKIKISMKTILITAGGLSPVGINTILSLKDFYKIVCVDAKSQSESVAPYFCKTYYEVPLASEENNYIKKILYICEEEKVEIILPLTIEETIVLLANINIFTAKGIRIANANTSENLKSCSDKWLTNDFLRKKGILVPNAIPVSNTNDMRQNIAKFGYPKIKVVIKPRITHGSRGFKIITENKDDLKLITELKPTDFHYVKLDHFCDIVENQNLNAVLMDYLEGDDYSVYTFCLNGEPLVILPMKRTGLIPGMSTGGILVEDKRIIKYITRVGKAFGFNDVINFQLKNTMPSPLLYEINTRISATTVIGRGTGINFPLFEMLLAENKIQEIKNKIAEVRIKWSLKLYRVQREIYNYEGNYYEI